MLPAILGLGGLTAKIIATAVIPRVVRAISQSFSTTRPPEPCPPSPVEGISSVPQPTPAPVLSGVSGTPIRSRKWGYAGLWHHQASGLDLATYRLYDAANKRWISRDPLGEGVDYNLYRYCGNAPIGKNDPAGLQPGAFVLTVNSARIDIDRNLIVDANLSILATPNRPIASPTVTVKVSVRRCGQWSVEYLKIHDYRSLADIGRQVLYPKNIEFPLNLSGDKWKDAEAIEVEMWADAVDVFLTPLGTRRFRKFFEF